MPAASVPRLPSLQRLPPPYDDQVYQVLRAIQLQGAVYFDVTNRSTRVRVLRRKEKARQARGCMAAEDQSKELPPGQGSVSPDKMCQFAKVCGRVTSRMSSRCHPAMDFPRRWPHIDFSFSHDPVLLASLGAHGAGDFRTLSAIAPGRQHSAQELRGGAWPCWTAGGQERWLRCRTWSRQEAVSACHGSTAGPDSSRQGTAGHTALRDSVEAPTHHPWPGGGRSGGCWPVVVVLDRA